MDWALKNLTYKLNLNFVKVLENFTVKPLIQVLWLHLVTKHSSWTIETASEGLNSTNSGPWVISGLFRWLTVADIMHFTVLDCLALVHDQTALSVFGDSV